MLRPGADARRGPRPRHNAARGTFVEVDGVVQPAPAPRFGRTPAGPAAPPDVPGGHTRQVLLDWGLTPAEVGALLGSGAAVQGGAPPPPAGPPGPAGPVAPTGPDQ